LGEDEIDSGLRLSSRRVGWLYPVLLDKHGNVIDGKHRLAADANWPKMRLDHVKSKEDRLIARLICNVCRRNVSAGEKSEIVQELGELHVKAGVKPGKELVSKISEETGMSYRWVMKYLPDNFKERPGVGGPSPVNSSLPGWSVVSEVLIHAKQTFLSWMLIRRVRYHCLNPVSRELLFQPPAGVL